MHQKLNDMMSDETQEKIENDQLEAEELARAIDNITDQNSFQQTVNTSAQAQIRGMKTTYADFPKQEFVQYQPGPRTLRNKQTL